ncbi:MAG: hypothetical protein QG568_201 [Patescibacteria group bacterium]|nr:hypothetical protein [Patescibacteria group bacterium]
MYIALTIIALVFLSVYVLFVFNMERQSGTQMKNASLGTVVYGEVFSLQSEDSIIVLPDFRLKYKGLIPLSEGEVQKIKKEIKDGIDGPNLAGYRLFERLPEPKESIINGKEIKFKNVPWGFAEFNVSGKTYTIQIVGFEFDNLDLPQFTITEGDMQKAREITKDERN